MTSEQLAAMIDHTQLKPAATHDEIVRLCQEAAAHRFATVCVAPCWVKAAWTVLQTSPVRVCTVVGFPMGYQSSSGKAHEARLAVNAGAEEIDMVLNVGFLKSGDQQAVRDDIAAAVQAVPGHTVKVIIETALLTDEEKVLACQLAGQAGAHFVKTCTGFNGGGATVEDIALMKRTVGDGMAVKASGGIRSREKAIALVEAGATRLGTSASLAIIEGKPEQPPGY